MAPLSSDRLALLRAALAEKGLAAPRAGALPRRATQGRAPLSSAQERLFFLELYEPGTALYNDALRVTLAGPLEPARLARAVAEVTARHEILRTSFVLGAEGPEQRISEVTGEAPGLRVLTPPADEASALELARAEACRPFELEEPPWRIALAPLGEERWMLVLTMHHILSDGASMGLFLDELAARYAGISAPPLAVQFGDFAAWERTQRDEARLAADRAYWRAELAAGLAAEPSPAPPSGAPVPATRTGAQARVELDADTLANLGALARGWQSTSSQLLLAAWLTLLAAERGTTAPCTGIASSLRTRRELEPLIGFFVQSLPLRVDLGDDPSFAVLVERVRAAALAAQAHSALPFEEILACAAGPGRKSAQPPQTFFSHMKDAIRSPALPGVEARWEFVDAGVARFELALVLHESAAGVTGFLEHELGLFPPAEGERLARAYERLVRAVIARPAERLSVLAPVRRPESAPRALRRPPLPSMRLRRAAGDGT